MMKRYLIATLVVALIASCSASQRAGELNVACALAPAGELGLNVIVGVLVDVVTGGTAIDPAVANAIDSVEQAIDARANAACAARDAGATMAARAPASLRLRAALAAHPVAHVAPSGAAQ